MKRSTLRATAASLLCVGLLVAASSAAFAQEPPRSQATPDEYSSKTPPPDEAPNKPSAYSPNMMRECIKRERAGDSTKSESEAKQACQDALRAKRENHDNEPRPPRQK